MDAWAEILPETVPQPQSTQWVRALKHYSTIMFACLWAFVIV